MIGKKLKELIKERNIKQIKLAKYVGISPSRLSNYLSDKREPDLEMLAKMAKYLGVDLNYFTDVKFTSKDMSYGDAPELDGKANDVSVDYLADDAVNVPYLSINSKKRASKTTTMPVSKIFFTGVDNPSDDAVVFEVTTGIGDTTFRQGDFVLAARFDMSRTENGALVFETGRNGKIYRYFKDNVKSFFLTEATNEIVQLPKNKDLSGYYSIIWIFRKV